MFNNHGGEMYGVKFENQAEFLPMYPKHLVVLFKHNPILKSKRYHLNSNVNF